MRTFLGRAVVLAGLILAAGLHSRPKTRVRKPTRIDGDAPHRTRTEIDAPRRTSKHARGANLRAIQDNLRQAAIGSTARPKAPGAPPKPKPFPRGHTRKGADGKDIAFNPDREKPKPKHTSGFNDGMPGPVYDPKTDTWTIHLRRHKDWDHSDFETKANHLKDLGDRGELVKTPTRGRPDDNARQWRSDKEHEIFWEAKNQADLDARIGALDSQQVDHAQDLQLGGKDSPDNMWAIDGATNHGMGGQIQKQLSQVPNGAKVRVKILRE